ncbi:uncharacterized protein LOC127811905 [Diospyros lotus]|uniref:uncharacterized protein LOC127811905 n=1 Tax=Diospyros lotus TaxID=55363 RepID=UPI002250390C|nr:uncharacterized protein LOC127811905 [Diospyros lotus]
MIMAQKGSRSKSRSKSKSGGRQEKRGSLRRRSSPLRKNSEGEGAVSRRKDEHECQLKTFVILKLGWISKSTAEDIKKWIESFGAFESEEVESEKLTMTGKVDTKRLRETVSGKAQLKNKIDVEKGPKRRSCRWIEKRRRRRPKR